MIMCYGLVNGDTGQIINGYDVAGNVCGSDNDVIEGVPLSGTDMTDKP